MRLDKKIQETAVGDSEEMKIDPKKILIKTKQSQRVRDSVTLYLDKPLWKAFQLACKGSTPSKVMEELMRHFVESTNAKKE